MKILAGLLALVLAGCAAPRELADFVPVQTERATIRWQRGNSSLMAEAICSRADSGAVLIRLTKQSPAPLLDLRLEPDKYLTARGTMAGRGWSGPYEEAPDQLAIWKAFLLLYQQSAGLTSGEREIHTSTYRAAVAKEGKALRALSLSSQDNTESLAAFFD